MTIFIFVQDSLITEFLPSSPKVDEIFYLVILTDRNEILYQGLVCCITKPLFYFIILIMLPRDKQVKINDHPG